MAHADRNILTEKIKIPIVVFGFDRNTSAVLFECLPSSKLIPKDGKKKSVVLFDCLNHQMHETHLTAHPFRCRRNSSCSIFFIIHRRSFGSFTCTVFYRRGVVGPKSSEGMPNFHTCSFVVNIGPYPSIIFQESTT